MSRFNKYIDTSNADKKKKKVDEAKFKNRDVSYIIDDFVRFLIGDRKQALNNLKKWTNVDINIPDDYNKTYNKLFDDISNAVMKTLDV
jgi:hypothetical protein